MNSRKVISKLLILILLGGLLITNVYADDYPDDIYDGDYSLNEMLENYNIITFGKKELDSRMHNVISYNRYSPNNRPIKKGDATLFHINSQFLINGEIKPSKNQAALSDYYPIRLDLRVVNENLKSYAKNIYQVSGLFCGYLSNNDINYECNISSFTIPNYIYTSKGSKCFQRA